MKIGIDIDEVLAEQLGSLVEFYKEEKGVFIPKEKFYTYYWPDVWNISLRDAIEIDNKFKESEMFDNLKITEGSLDAIKLFSDKHKLSIITARPKKFKDKTLNWLNLNFGDLFGNIFHTCEFHKDNGNNKSKSDICKEFGVDLLIEDSADNSLDCAKNGIKVLLLDKPWNQKAEHENIRRCFNWDEIVEVVNELDMLQNEECEDYV